MAKERHETVFEAVNILKNEGCQKIFSKMDERLTMQFQMNCNLAEPAGAVV